jgi:5'-nucleotidase
VQGKSCLHLFFHFSLKFKFIMTRPLILVTNDDGIESDGLHLLAAALKALGEVIVVAPRQDMTAVSHALTLHTPLRIETRDSNCYTINGTPTDCVILALSQILPDHKPDLVVSGINRGANVGDDVHYSGTVAAALEATMHAIPSIAVSLAGWKDFDFQPAATFAAQLAQRVLEQGLPPGLLLNVNVPRQTIQGVKFTKQGKKASRTKILQGQDPRGRPYFWIDRELIRIEQDPASDLMALKEGFIAITPLKVDLTAHAEQRIFAQEWAFTTDKF